jgi:hypothetical protein
MCQRFIYCSLNFTKGYLLNKIPLCTYVKTEAKEAKFWEMTKEPERNVIGYPFHRCIWSHAYTIRRMDSIGRCTFAVVVAVY